MPDEIRYDAALAAALVAIDILDADPAPPKYELLGRFTYIVLEAIYEVERRLHEGRVGRPSDN